MREMVLTHNDLLFWTGGDGKLTLALPPLDLTSPLPPTLGTVVAANFKIDGTDLIEIGTPGALKLGIKSGTSAHLIPIWRTSNGELKQLLGEFGLEGFLPVNPDHLILALRLGASASGTAAGTFKYTTLSAKSTVEVGGDVGYSYFRAYPIATPAGELIASFFREFRLPSDVTRPLSPGEVIAFEYGGYLKVAAGVSVGYEIKGTPQFQLGALQLSEHFQFSLLGKIGLNANVAGHFSVQVRGLQDPGWVRIIVRRKRQNILKVAADVTVEADSQLEGLPESSRDFLSAALGVHVKNWFNMLDRVRTSANLDSLKSKLDKLALDFLNDYIEKTFGAIPADFNLVVQKINSVVSKYETVENSAISLFDRYYGNLGTLAAKLSLLQQLTAWEKLESEIDADLWNILLLLTGGDALGWMLGKVKLPGSDQALPSLDVLKQRVEKTLEFMQDVAHAEIRDVIRLAKENYNIDQFFIRLATIKSTDDLKAQTGERVGHFVERLIGHGIEELRSTEQLDKALERIQDALEAEANFRERLYAKFTEAARQSLRFKLHSEYSRADESSALVDIAINVGLTEGQKLMAAAGRGDFQQVLATYRPELVRINEGILTHKASRETAFKVNILGWHHDFNYSGFDRVIVESEQRIQADPSGTLTIYSNVALSKEKERRRNGERMYTNFLLQFLGESRGLLQADPKRSQYLIDIITGMAATYELHFTDDKTEPEQLKNYLSFAKDFGLDKAGATFELLQQLLPMDDVEKHYGPVSTHYEVRYTQAGLAMLFRGPFDEAFVRSVMRKIVFANYFRLPALQDIAWFYSEEVYRKREQINRSSGQLFSNLRQLHLEHPRSPIPGIEPPTTVDLSSNVQIRVLDTLFRIEEQLTAGMRNLHRLIQAGQRLPVDQFKNAMQEIGEALTDFDTFDEGVNTVFALLDRLIDRATPSSQVRASSLKLVSKANGREVTKIFVLQPSVVAGTLSAAAPESTGA